jgi:hypothetical protein
MTMPRSLFGRLRGRRGPERPAASEYDPLFSGPEGEAGDDLEAVRDRFARAGRPFLRSPWTWVGWALVLPAAALATPAVAARWGFAGVLLLWSGGILAGGVVEAASIARAGRREPRGPLAGWVLRMQGNTSLLAVVLSALLLWADAAWALPGLWLLLLGHSLYLLGGLAFPAFRTCGLLYQAGGLVALWPGGPALPVFAAVTLAGNLWLAWSVWREVRA